MASMNRRRYNRFPLQLKCSVTCGKKSFSGLAADLSRAGLFLPGVRFLKKRDKAELCLSLPGSKSGLRAACSVARVGNGAAALPPGAALVFGRFAAKDAKAFAAFFAAMPAAARKDRAPKDTIRFAHRQLKRAGLSPKVMGQWAIGKNFYSVRLEDPRLSIGVNGKGLTPEFALASAYGEFLERIQNGALLQDRFGLMPAGETNRQGFRTKTFPVLMREHGDIMGKLIEFPLPAGAAAGLAKKKVACVPFYSVTDSSFVGLPLKYLAQVTGTNGMCAGNTPEEAILQGLAEIAERYVTREVICGRHTSIPTIPLAMVPSAGLRARIKALGSRGYKVTIKDCTFGGRFPVIGTILTAVGTQTYMGNFGAAPTFDVALERCLTEAFQGPRELTLPLTFDSPAGVTARHYEFYSTCRTGAGRMPAAMFLSGGRPEFAPAFLDVFQSNRNALKHMLDCFRREGAKIFIRDRSCLGFPAYRLYIPGYSELEKWNRDIPIDFEEVGLKLRRTGLDLKGRSRAEAGAMAEVLEELFKTPRFAFESSRYLPKLLMGILRVNLARPNDLADELCHSREKLLSILFHRAGNHLKAAKYLRLHLESHPKEASDYMSCCLAYFTLKAGGGSAGGISARLNSFFEPKLAREVTGDLDTPEKAFRYYKLPACGNCSRCEIRKNCRYEIWRSATSSIRKLSAKTAVSQESLRTVFAGI